MAGQEQVVIGRERELVGATVRVIDAAVRVGAAPGISGTNVIEDVDEVAVADGVPPTGATSSKEATNGFVQATPSVVDEER